ncbi:MAG: amino acid adenylation domain-containing protein, partial [bacterium]|nr:amino acid adenylation domain-containing protein [bacterium]
MNVEDFLQELASQGIELWLERERVRYRAPEQVMTPTLLSRMKANKAAIREALRQGDSISTSHLLSYGQQGLWLIYQQAPESAAYNYAFAGWLLSEIDLSAFQRTLQTLTARHPVLRSTFALCDGDIVQHIHGYREIPMEVTDASDWSRSELERQVRCAYQRPFDLEHGPVMRVNLFTCGAERSVLLMTWHHIVIDGSSLPQVLDDLRVMYAAERSGQAAGLAPLSRSYADFTAWQSEMLAGAEGERLWAYWRQQLSGTLPVLTLPADRPRPPVPTYHGDAHAVELPEWLSDQVRQTARAEGVTLFMLFLAAFKVLLSRYTGQVDLLVGAPSEGRHHGEFSDVVGYFVNMLPLRTDLSGNPSFREVLVRVRRTVLDAMTHEDYPFALLVERLQPERDGGVSPVFQVAFGFQSAHQFGPFLDIPGKRRIHWGEFEVEPFGLQQQTGQFELSLDILEGEDLFRVEFKYQTDLFNADTITRMSDHFQVLLEGMLTNPDHSLAQLPLLTDAEQQQLQAWNHTATSTSSVTEYPDDQTIVDLFQVQVEHTPDNIAVVFDDHHLSYRALNTKANQLAHYLMTLGVHSETLAGLCVERSLEMVIGMLGILKAGGAYVPLDPEYPPERVQFMVEDSEVQVVVSQRHLLKRLPVSTTKVMCLDREWEQIAGCSGENPLRQSEPEHVAYVMYTSGSTGRPKGVMVGHRNLCHSTWVRQIYYRSTGLEAFLLLSPVGFDSSIAGIFWSLTQGAMLVVPEKQFDIRVLTQLVRKHWVTHLLCVPTLYSALLSHPDSEELADLRAAILAGESGSQTLLAQHYTKLPNTKLFNEYGPTEGTVWVSVHYVKSPHDSFECIGRPIANTHVYILDTNHNPTPPGIPGELCIAGAGLARGYLNRPELTAEKFIEIELFGQKQRIYTTGDVARWLPDGTLEFLGRLDRQVKLRGFRIELGEIEATLSRHEAVQEAVVMLHTQEDHPRLVAYVTLTMPVDDVSGVLRAWLTTRLPDYMLPAGFTVLDTLPITPNGKIDRNALPTPDLTIQAEQQPPRTDTEQLLCTLWSHVLGRDVTSITSHFFEAGGHSLLATQLMSRIRESFGIDMPLRVMFEQPVLQEQAAWIDTHQRGSELPPIRPLAEGEPFVLSFAQQRLWFLTQLEGHSATYTLPAAVHLTGPLDETALQDALTALIQRHESLRVCFPMVDGEATVQLNEVYNPLIVTDLSTL